MKGLGLDGRKVGDVGKACSDEGWMEEMDGKRWRRGAWLKHTTPVAPCPVMFEEAHRGMMRY